MKNEKNETSIYHLQREIIFLIASILDPKSLLSFRRVNTSWEEISRYLFIALARDQMASDKIACGHSSVFLARANGELWGWGENWHNQLALNHFTYSNRTELQKCFKPKLIGYNNVAEIVMGTSTSFAIIKGESILASGRNIYGEFGLGNREDYSVPKFVPNLKATQIAVGNDFALAITEDGTLYSWGENNYGQLGHGDITDSDIPKNVANIPKVKKIAVGGTFSAAVTMDGRLYAWGNLNMDLKGPFSPELVENSKNIVDIAAGQNFIMTLENNGKVLTWCNNDSGQLESFQVPDIENIIKISANHNSGEDDRKDCLALSIDDGTVYSWSHEGVRFKKHTPQKIINQIVEIGQGLEFSVVINKHGQVYSWGKNNVGQLGIGEEHTECATPQKVLSFESSRFKLMKNLTERFTKERLVKASLKTAQKTSLCKNLTFFSSKNENQFNKEVEELKQILSDEKSSIVQLEDKIDNCLELFENDTSKKAFCDYLSDMKKKLYLEKDIIRKEADIEVFTLMMKRN